MKKFIFEVRTIVLVMAEKVVPVDRGEIRRAGYIRRPK